jgi:hypothetical protein
MPIPKAKRLLTEATVVTSAKVYSRGDFSVLSVAFTVLWRELTYQTPHWKEIFEMSNSVHGKIYALIALWIYDAEVYEDLKRTLDGQTPVNIKMGCIEWKEPVAEVLRMIEDGKLFRRVVIPEGIVPLQDVAEVESYDEISRRAERRAKHTEPQGQRDTTE